MGRWRKERPDKIGSDIHVHPGGGIGRHAGFRNQYPQGFGSSSLPPGTNLNEKESIYRSWLGWSPRRGLVPMAKERA